MRNTRREHGNYKKGPLEVKSKEREGNEGKKESRRERKVKRIIK